jgi:hypothetical protein
VSGRRFFELDAWGASVLRALGILFDFDLSRAFFVGRLHGKKEVTCTRYVGPGIMRETQEKGDIVGGIRYRPEQIAGERAGKQLSDCAADTRSAYH